MKRWEFVVIRELRAVVEVECDNTEDRDSIVWGRIMQGRVDWVIQETKIAGMTPLDEDVPEVPKIRRDGG